MNYQRVLRGSLAIPMRHHLTTVPLARLGTDEVGGWLFLAPWRVGIPCLHATPQPVARRFSE
eukprot:scaffold19931_cov33-Phaeocystis_antarctica.AAC.1